MAYPSARTSVAALSKTSLDLLINIIRKKRQALRQIQIHPLEITKSPSRKYESIIFLPKCKEKVSVKTFGDFWPTCLMMSWQDHRLKLVFQLSAQSQAVF